MLVAPLRKLAFAAALLSCAAQVTVEAVEQDETVWHCWYETERSFRIRCTVPEKVAQGAPEDDGLEEFRELREALLRSSRPADATRLVRAMPAAFRGPVLDIPLYGPPVSGVEFSARLARAATCGRNKSCSVAFEPDTSPAHVATAGRSAGGPN